MTDLFHPSVHLSISYFQLSDAISIIGREDFPEKWDNLLPVGSSYFIVIKFVLEMLV